MKLRFLLCLSLTPFLPLKAITVAVDPVETGGFTRFLGAAMAGWTFTADANLNVSQLGYYDYQSNGLVMSHQVGIWNLGGSLLGSATVSTSDPLLDGFRYVAVTPLSLLAGQSYVIAGFQAAEGDSLLTFGSGYSGVSFAPQISFGQPRSIFTGSFSRPDTNFVTSGGVFGPNFQFDVAFASVPDSGSASALLMLGVGFLVGARRVQRFSRI